MLRLSIVQALATELHAARAFAPATNIGGEPYMFSVRFAYRTHCVAPSTHATQTSQLRSHRLLQAVRALIHVNWQAFCLTQNINDSALASMNEARQRLSNKAISPFHKRLHPFCTSSMGPKCCFVDQTGALPDTNNLSAYSICTILA